MRTKLRSKFTLLLVVCAALLAVPAIAMALTADPSGSTSPAPTIQSDKADYGPGATVTLTGSNWQPGESVNIVVNDDAGQTWSRNVNVTADASGNIKDQFNLPDWFVATYKVTATGAQSGVATTSFTDGSLRGTTNLPNTTPDTTTTVQYSLYDGSGCNGTPTKNGTQTLTESSTPNISSVGANESMKVTAAATASNGWVFDKWTTTDATISFVPAGDTTSRTICVQGFQANQQTIKANYTALAATNDSYSTSEDNALNVAAPGVLANDTGSNLSAVKVTNPTHGSVTLNANGSFTYTPDANYNGPDSFTYKANNGTADSNTATVNITVTAVNDAPKAVNDSYSVNEDGTLNVADGANDVLSNDTDADGDSLTVTNNTSPAHGSVTVNANGSFTYTPNGNYHGPDSFNYTVSDGKGGTSTGTVNITVTAVNDKPTAENQSVTTDEDNAKEITLTGNDVDGDSLTYEIVSGPQNGELTGDGATRTYTPDANYHGPDSFTYKVNDGTVDSETATVNITVTAVNDTPVADNDSYSTDEDTQISVPAPGVLGNDTDVDGDNLSAVLGTGPSHGTLTLNANGSFTYNPAANYNGSDSFTYRANDGTANSDTATVNITVTAVNDKPTAENQSVTTDEDNAKEITLTGNDVDGDSLTYEIVSGPQNGELTGDGATRTYTPDANYHGPDSFTYKVNDGTVDSETATVNITVTPVNDAPDAVNDTATTDEDTSALIDVKANDTDVDGDTLTITNVTNPAHGTAVVEDGKVKYTPAANYNGSDSFTYTVSDGNGGTDTATVNLTVTAVNDGSTVTLSGAALANEGETQTYTFTVNDPDSGDTFTVKSGFPDCGTGGNLVAGSLTTTASGGSFKCTFPDGPANPTVRIQVTDGGSADSNEATKSVTVANVNPTIGTLTTTGSGTACLGSNNVVKLSFSITDPGVDTQSGTINWGDGTTTEFNGSSVTDATHSYSAGTYTITVTAKDSDGGPAVPKSTSGTQNVSLLYNVSELQDPVNRTGMTMSVFKSGSTVPLKVIITDCNNQPVNGLVPRISFNRINPSTPALGVNEALSTQPNDTNFLMRDAGNGQYIYNLNTKTLPDQDATYNANITDSKATQTAPATYAKVTQTFGIRTK